ncbi:MAG: glycosyltransferase family 39 protein [Planctomycetes bacterium]|nr:glycosyltransferase family 39 protein [Planctomycetota bacterium]
MHAAGPAWRMTCALAAFDAGGFADALLDCERYPFVFPLLLGLEQLVFGISEQGARVFCTLLWCATVLAVFGVARRASGSQSAGWIALLAAATSPLALSFAGTVLLEVPAACAIALALWMWIRRRELAPSRTCRRTDFAAGAALALAFFTKFNYGLLLAAGLALDEAVELALAARKKHERVALASLRDVLLVPALLLVWWFLLPLPDGLERAAEHRTAFFEWITGNQELAQASWKVRLLNVTSFFAPNPRAALLLALGALLALREWRRPATRALLFVAVVLLAGVLGHPFHLPRFLIPAGPALWALSGIGWSVVLPKSVLPRVGAVATAVLVCAAWPGLDTAWLAERLGFLSQKPDVREYQLAELATQRDLRGSRRLRSLGLARDESERFFELVGTGVGPDERVGWIDLTEEVAPAGLEYGLLAHGRERHAFANALARDPHISIGGVDPHWDDERLFEWAARFDVLLFSEPHHVRGRAGREFFGDYVRRLEGAHWRRASLGRLAIARPMKPPLSVELFTLRRAR